MSPSHTTATILLLTSPLRFIVLFWLPDFDSHVTGRGKRVNPRSDVGVKSAQTHTETVNNARSNDYSSFVMKELEK